MIAICAGPVRERPGVLWLHVQCHGPAEPGAFNRQPREQAASDKVRFAASSNRASDATSFLPTLWLMYCVLCPRTLPSARSLQDGGYILSSWAYKDHKEYSVDRNGTCKEYCPIEGPMVPYNV